MTKNPFHKWLIRQRHYCELCTGPYPATEVIEYKGRNTVVCSAHFWANEPRQARKEYYAVSERKGQKYTYPMGQIETGLRERGRLEAR